MVRAGDITSSLVIAPVVIRSSTGSRVSTADCIVSAVGDPTQIRSCPAFEKAQWPELEEIRELEAPVRDGATGIDIENLLVAIAQNTRAKPEKLDGARYFFDDCLNVEQRTRTYTVLLALAENLPGRQSLQEHFMLKHRQALENAEWKAKLKGLDA